MATEIGANRGTLSHAASYVGEGVHPSLRVGRTLEYICSIWTGKSTFNTMGNIIGVFHGGIEQPRISDTMLKLL